MLLRARVVLPVSQPPIEDGAVLVTGTRIVAVGRWRDLADRSEGVVVDLGDAALLPGLINAHCHLDYTAMAGLIPPPKKFTDWITEIVALKAQWSYADYAQSWVRGARQLVRSGVTTVADIEAVPELLPEVWTATPLRVISFLELLNVRSRIAPRLLVRDALAERQRLDHHRGSLALSPHSPYSTSFELLHAAARAAHRARMRLSTHVAESEEEFEMFVNRRGPMFNWLKRQRDMRDCGAGSPVQHVAAAGLLGKNFLAVHVNYLADGDAQRLGGAGASVAHCPRSHEYFGHQRFPFHELAEAGVNICLGTDSLASTRKARSKLPELSLFAELRTFAAAHPEVAPEELLAMATINGARALGLAGRAGELKKGAYADVIAVPFSGKPADAAESVVQHDGEVAASLIAGKWAVPPAQIL
ncbi:MAG: amidohydrolase family protein [Verrucomicrobia bacterium]|nr:amidohydrolase family protein [Verrucomicrobiota bacterium]